MRRTLKQGLGGCTVGQLTRILECYDATKTILVVRQAGTVVSSCSVDNECFQAPYPSFRGPHELPALDQAERLLMVIGGEKYQGEVLRVPVTQSHEGFTDGLVLMSVSKSHQDTTGASGELNTKDWVGEAAAYVSTPVYTRRAPP